MPAVFRVFAIALVAALLPTATIVAAADVEAIRAAGGEILGVLALVDRQEGGTEALEAAGLKVISLVTAADLLPLIPSA